MQGVDGNDKNLRSKCNQLIFNKKYLTSFTEFNDDQSEGSVNG
jgi:hypothetical protein